jgi:hypothetical protein
VTRVRRGPPPTGAMMTVAEILTWVAFGQAVTEERLLAERRVLSSVQFARLDNLLVALTARSAPAPYTPLARAFSPYSYTKPPAGRDWAKAMQDLRARERARAGRLIAYSELRDDLARELDRPRQYARVLRAAYHELRPVLVAGRLVLFGRLSVGHEHDAIKPTTFMDSDASVTWEDNGVLGPHGARMFEDVRGRTVEILAFWPAGDSPKPESKRSSELRRSFQGLTYATSDAPLVAEMGELIRAGKARGPWEAALAVSGRAEGHGNTISKAKRLVNRYSVRSASSHC